MTNHEQVGYHASITVRWSDMDAFAHINHARMVTLLEEARIEWLLSTGVELAERPISTGVEPAERPPSAGVEPAERPQSTGVEPAERPQSTGVEPAERPRTDRDGANESLIKSALIVNVNISYKKPLRHSDSPLDVTLWFEKVRTVDFTIGYEVRAAGASADSAPAVLATTQMAMVDVGSESLRRISAEEKAYLARWSRQRS